MSWPLPSITALSLAWWWVRARLAVLLLLNGDVLRGWRWRAVRLLHNSNSSCDGLAEAWVSSFGLGIRIEVEN